MHSSLWLVCGAYCTCTVVLFIAYAEKYIFKGAQGPYKYPVYNKGETGRSYEHTRLAT